MKHAIQDKMKIDVKCVMFCKRFGIITTHNTCLSDRIMSVLQSIKIKRSKKTKINLICSNFFQDRRLNYQ